MIVVGIDPGVFGAIVALSEINTMLHYKPFPYFRQTNSRCISDGAALQLMLAEFKETLDLTGQEIKTWLEMSIPMPRQASQVTHQTGINWGLVKGILLASDWGFETLHPRVWSGHIHKGYKADTAKIKSTMVLSQEYPEDYKQFVSGMFNKKETEGLIDARLIATYGLMKAQKMKEGG